RSHNRFVSVIVSLSGRNEAKNSARCSAEMRKIYKSAQTSQATNLKLATRQSLGRVSTWAMRCRQSPESGLSADDIKGKCRAKKQAHVSDKTVRPSLG